MPQHSLSFQNNIWFDDPFGLILFEYDVEQLFNRSVSDALFAMAKSTPFLSSAEVRLFFRIDSEGCAFSTKAQAGFSFLCALDIASPYFEAMTATADDLVNKGLERKLAWQLSVKNCYNEQAKLPLPNYYDQLPQGYWEHILLAAKNALMNSLLQPQAELSDTCTPAHADQIDALITKLTKVTLHTPPHAVVYRCTLFTAADLRNILAAAGLNPACARQYEDCNGQAVVIKLERAPDL